MRSLISSGGRTSSRPSVRTLAATSVTGASSATIPASCTNVTVKLGGENSQVYILGVSHVSKVDLGRIRDLIAAVRPEVVLVELCKDRTGLFLDPQSDPASPSQRWHLQRIEVKGCSAAEGMPQQSALLAAAGIAPGEPVSKSDMESGAVSLLSTGLFKSVAIACSQAPPGTPPILLPRPNAASAAAPLSLSGAAAEESDAVEPVLALGTLTYSVTMRPLPAPSALTLTGDAAPTGPAAADLIADSLQRCRANGTVQGYMHLRAQLLAAGAKGVTFSGLESGTVLVTATATSPAAGAEITGLEGSAVNGKGLAIENAFTVPPRAPTAAAAKPRVFYPEGFTVGGPRPDAGTTPPPAQANPLAVALARALTGPYAQAQGQAGKTVGVQPGAAWRAALAAGAAAGAQVVLLGDRPTDVTRVRLADGIFVAMVGRWLAGVAAVGAAVGLTAAGAVPDGLAFPTIATGLAVLVGLGGLPLLSPLTEVQAFAAKSAREIEDIVEMKTPLASDPDTRVQVWGEDALLHWPGAQTSVIHERDRYMAHVIKAAATGKPAVVPAYLRASDGSFRYAAAAQGPRGANLVGLSQPASYEQLRGARAVVAVVGTAHVKGIVRAWAEGAMGREELEKLV